MTENNKMLVKRLKELRREFAASLRVGTRKGKPTPGGATAEGLKWMRDHFRPRFRSINARIKELGGEL